MRSGINGEKTKGRKRHIVVDTMGNLLAVRIHTTNIHDTKSGILAARDAFGKYPSIQRFCADAGCCKTFERDVSRELGLGVNISVRIKPEWEILPKRWIVERSLAQINNSRRLSKDYEISVRSAPRHLSDCCFSYFTEKVLTYWYSLLDASILSRSLCLV